MAFSREKPCGGEIGQRKLLCSFGRGKQLVQREAVERAGQELAKA
jgi:hypothetical protein